MDAPDRRLLIEIGERAGDFQDAVVAACRKLHLFSCVAQQLQPARIWLRHLLDHCRRTASIGKNLRHAEGDETVRLYFAGAGHTPCDGGARLGWRRADQIGGGDGGDIDADVDPVHQRAGDSPLIVGDATWTARTTMARFSRHAAAAGVHGRHELDRGRIGDAVVGAGDDAFGGFERLAQGIEDLRGEFRETRRETERHCAQARLPPAWRAGRRRSLPPSSRSDVAYGRVAGPTACRPAIVRRSSVSSRPQVIRRERAAAGSRAGGQRASIFRSPVARPSGDCGFRRPLPPALVWRFPVP